MPNHDYQGSEHVTYEKLFDQLSIIIADILSACFMNLPPSSIGKRKESTNCSYPAMLNRRDSENPFGKEAP